jgi:hypothetical protein
MKKAVSSFLAASALLAAPGALSHFATGFAQAAPAAAASGQVQMDPAEYADYDNAVNKQTTPQTQAPAIEAYLAKYPKSAVKADVLQRLLLDYSQFDPAKAITTADQVLQLNPNDIQALTVETVFRAQQAQAMTDAAAKQSAMDQAASYAQKGLDATKPASMSQADFDKAKTVATSRKTSPERSPRSSPNLPPSPSQAPQPRAPRSRIPTIWRSLITRRFLLTTSIAPSTPPAPPPMHPRSSPRRCSRSPPIAIRNIMVRMMGTMRS